MDDIGVTYAKGTSAEGADVKLPRLWERKGRVVTVYAVPMSASPDFEPLIELELPAD